MQYEKYKISVMFFSTKIKLLFTQRIFKLWNATKYQMECNSLCNLFFIRYLLADYLLQPFATNFTLIWDSLTVHLVCGFGEANKPNWFKYIDCVLLYCAAE